MASSLAAMPHDSAPWRDPSTTRPRRGFFNVLVPPHRQSSFVSDAAAPAPPAEPTPRRSRRVILERWAAAAAAAADSDARRPRDREAELSALASATRPIAARAAVFREPSPAPSDASSTATAAAGPDLPPSGPRASSLIQRWREIEAVGPVTPRASGDVASESDGSPRGRVGCIVKKLSGAASLPEEDLDAANNELSLSQSAPSSPASALRNAVESLAVRIKGPRPPKLVVRTVRGRRAMEELVARMAHRHRRELAALVERHVVSRFGHKGRIQMSAMRSL